MELDDERILESCEDLTKELAKISDLDVTSGKLTANFNGKEWNSCSQFALRVSTLNSLQITANNINNTGAPELEFTNSLSILVYNFEGVGEYSLASEDESGVTFIYGEQDGDETVAYFSDIENPAGFFEITEIKDGIIKGKFESVLVEPDEEELRSTIHGSFETKLQGE